MKKMTDKERKEFLEKKKKDLDKFLESNKKKTKAEFAGD